MSEVLIIGAGYVGLPIAVRAVEAGHTVTVAMSPTTRSTPCTTRALLRRGRVRRALACRPRSPRSGSVLWTSAGSNAKHLPFEIALITVPTPVDELKRPDLTYIKERSVRTSRRTCAAASSWCWSPPPTPARPRTWWLARSHPLPDSAAPKDYDLGYSPERINPGDPVNTVRAHPEDRLRTGREGSSAGPGVLRRRWSIRPCWCPRPRPPSWSRCSRTPSPRSTSHWSTRWHWSAPSWVSTWTRSWTLRRPRATPSCGSVRGPASVGTASPWTRCT